ncbi:MAG: pantetheine-phosphate adenylyltransferase [Candidatus Aenigmatarchaeota archaeon]|nr:MAG: pantetheine-phosphate adenylyltransferase [Candidatus Aenigmarchaeota archaeon]
MSYILIGGTFDSLHRGHREFIRQAFVLGDKVLICLTSDDMVKEKPDFRDIGTYEKRKGKLELFLREKGWIDKAEIVKIEDPFTEGLRPELTHIVVSEETEKNAEKINDMREDRNMKPLGLILIKWVLSDDGKPISDARIRSGEIDSEGRLRKG